MATCCPPDKADIAFDLSSEPNSKRIFPACLLDQAIFSSGVSQSIRLKTRRHGAGGGSDLGLMFSHQREPALLGLFQTSQEGEEVDFLPRLTDTRKCPICELMFTSGEDLFL